jgi:dihydroneopterin aldolase
MIIELRGLELFGRHGVGEDERREGQTFLVDVTLEIAEPRADDLDATYDYRRARDIVRDVNRRASYTLLETFAAAAADALAAEPRVVHARVRIRKPGVQWAEWTAVTAERP